MSEEYERGYESTSLRKGLKEDLKSLQRTDETYSDVIRRALTALAEKDERQESQREWQNQILHSMARLQVRMAVESGLSNEQIPDNLAEYEAWGGYSPFAPTEEEVTDINQAQKEAEFQAHEELLEEQDIDDESKLHGRVDEEKVQRRAQEILEERGEPDNDYAIAGELR